MAKTTPKPRPDSLIRSPISWGPLLISWRVLTGGTWYPHHSSGKVKINNQELTNGSLRKEQIAILTVGHGCRWEKSNISCADKQPCHLAGRASHGHHLPPVTPQGPASQLPHSLTFVAAWLQTRLLIVSQVPWNFPVPAPFCWIYWLVVLPGTPKHGYDSISHICLKPETGILIK